MVELLVVELLVVELLVVLDVLEVVAGATQAPLVRTVVELQEVQEVAEVHTKQPLEQLRQAAFE